MLYQFLWMLLSLSALWAAIIAFGTNVWRVLQSSDTGWIVRTGEYIIFKGCLPTHDIFSWTCTGCRFVTYQWLFEVAAGGLFAVGGLWLVGLRSARGIPPPFLFLLPRQWLALGVPAAVTFGFLALTINPQWFYARPQLISFALIAVFAGLLEQSRKEHNRKAIWLLPPLMVLWANTHSFWFIGLLMVASYWLTGLFRQQGPRTLGLVLVACAGAVLLNPYGADLVRYNLAFVSEPDFARINELRPALHGPLKAMLPFLSYLCLSWFMVIWRWKAVPPAGLVLMAAATVAALCMRRFAPVAAILCWPYVGLALADLGFLWRQLPASSSWLGLLQENKTGSPGRLLASAVKTGLPARQVFLLALALGTAVACWYRCFPDPDRTWLTHSGNRRKAIGYLEQHSLGTRIFNDATTGSNLILAGLLPVFIDTRFDMYGRQFCQDWQDCMDARPGWREYLNRLKVTHVVVGRYYPLNKALAGSGEWLKVFDDRQMAIWVRHPVPPNGIRPDSGLRALSSRGNGL